MSEINNQTNQPVSSDAQKSNEENPIVPETEPTGLAAKQEKLKENLIEQLRKTPIVQVACEKLGIGRTTFYRWKKEDREFAEAVEIAINSGADLVSDMAESKLVGSIKEGNLSAIFFWLKNRHKSYATKLEMVGSSKPIIEQLSPEQEAIIQKALELSTFTLPEETSTPETEKEPDHAPELSANAAAATTAATSTQTSPAASN